MNIASKSTCAKRLALFAAALALSLCGIRPAPARADGGVTDVDRRATLALWNSFSAPRKVWKLADVSDDAVGKLDMKPKPGLRQYAVSFGAKAADASGRGFHKITIGAPPRDPATEKDPWTKVSDLADPQATVWKKSHGVASDPEHYAEYAVRGSVGSVVLIVDQRRPLDEGDAAPTKDLGERYRALLDAARKAGLFAHVKATLFVGDGDADGTDLAEATPAFSLNRGGSTLRLRLEMLDVEDKPVEPKGYTLQLTGPLAPYATVEGAESEPAKKRWLVKNPGSRREVTITIPPETEEMTRAVYAHTISGSKEPKIGFSIRGYQK